MYIYLSTEDTFLKKKMQMFQNLLHSPYLYACTRLLFNTEHFLRWSEQPSLSLNLAASPTNSYKILWPQEWLHLVESQSGPALNPAIRQNGTGWIWNQNKQLFKVVIHTTFFCYLSTTCSHEVNISKLQDPSNDLKDISNFFPCETHHLHSILTKNNQLAKNYKTYC